MTYINSSLGVQDPHKKEKYLELLIYRNSYGVLNPDVNKFFRKMKKNRRRAFMQHPFPRYRNP
jgi:hypothetical protein